MVSDARTRLDIECIRRLLRTIGCWMTFLLTDAASALENARLSTVCLGMTVEVRGCYCKADHLIAELTLLLHS